MHINEDIIIIELLYIYGLKFRIVSDMSRHEKEIANAHSCKYKYIVMVYTPVDLW